MKLVWCPDTASKAYIDTVKSVGLFEETTVAELISAMAGGWNPHLIVETWSHRGAIATSIGLAVAARHTGGRHVCLVQDERSRLEYAEAMHQAAGISPEIVVGEAEEVMSGLPGIDFLVVDSRRRDSARVLRLAEFGPRGAVLVCTNASPRSSSEFRWRSVLDGGGARVVRSAYLPVGNGVEIAHVGAAGGSSSPGKGTSRWVRHMDQSGEEHVFRR